MKRIDISIIVPIYNAEKYLKKCIDSLINQTKKEIEIILINDGSTDNSEKIIKEYNDERIVYFKNKNQGIGITRNFGIERSHGKYLLFIDSDDYIELNTCEVLYNKVIEEKLDIVVCNFYKDFEDGRIEKITIDKFNTTSIKENPKIINIINPSPWNKLFKKELIDKNNIRFVENKKYEDAPFFTGAIKYAKRIGQVNDYLNYYVIHNNSETLVRDRRCFDIFDILDIIRGQYKEIDYMKEEVDKLTVFIVTNYTMQQRAQKNSKTASEFIDKAFLYLKENVPDYKNKKYYDNKSFLRRNIENKKGLSKMYCNVARLKYGRR